MNVTRFPVRGPQRLEKLKAALRPLDTSTMSTPEVVAFCEEALPDASVNEMIAALRQVGYEHLAEADHLERVKCDPDHEP